MEEALLLPPAERMAYLRAHSADETVRAEAEQLLALSTDASSLLGVDRWRALAAEALESGLTASGLLEDELQDGALIGRFRIVGRVGSGGMGSVYRAERADGEYQQTVAVKVLREGLSTEALTRRFLEERQILARLTHPCIARLLDGGLTAERKPYLVLEFVEGVAIDRYCTDHALDAEAILRLFVSVCQAVQSAHQQLILHLDLKPANILVTAAGDPRLLDFGIARFLPESGGEELVDPTLRLLTPRYASPEQATGAPLGVGSDVFSLGTLLYKLLTGRLPYPIEDLSPLQSARMICEADPTPPSQAVSPSLAASLRGDLDTILLHALNKEPARRYLTVQGFADDIERYLASRPVLAHRDTLRYRAGKFLRRNQWASLVSAASAVLLLAGMGAVVHSAIIARQERATAERRLRDVRTLAHSYIFDLIPELDGIPGTLKVRGEVVQRALGYLEAMSKEKTSDPDMLRELSAGYSTMGKMQGGSYTISLGDRKTGWDLLNRSLSMQRQLVAGHPENLADRAHLVVTLREVASMLISSGDIVGGKALHKESWDVGQPILAAGPQTPAYLSVANSAWFVSMSESGLGMWNLADPAAGVEWARRSEAVLQRYAAVHPEVRHTQPYITQWTMSRASEGDALGMMGRHDEALALYPELLAMVEEPPLLEDSRSVGTRRLIHDRYARLLLDGGDLRRATELSAMLRPSERRDRLEAGKNLWEAFNMATTTEWTALLDWRNGRRAEARLEIEACLRAFRALQESEPDLTWPVIDIVGGLQEFADLPGMPPDEALTMYREAAELAAAYGRTHPEVSSAKLEEARSRAGIVRLAKGTGDTRLAEEQAVLVQGLLTPLVAVRPELREARAMLEATR